MDQVECEHREANSLLCVGLDPHPGQIPDRYGSVSEFMRAVVEQTADLACVFKPNIAFYEALGPDGLDTLQEILEAIPDDVPVLLDGKRNDIASSAVAYAQGAFDRLGADALTVNPYLGSEAWRPLWPMRIEASLSCARRPILARARYRIGRSTACPSTVTWRNWPAGGRRARRSGW